MVPEMSARGRQREILAKHLAEFYGPPKQTGPCACNTPLCMEVGCPEWWDFVLRFDRTEWATVMRLFFDTVNTLYEAGLVSFEKVRGLK